MTRNMQMMLCTGETAGYQKSCFYRKGRYCTVYEKTGFYDPYQYIGRTAVVGAGVTAARRPCVTTDVGCCRESFWKEKKEIFLDLQVIACRLCTGMDLQPLWKRCVNPEA